MLQKHCIGEWVLICIVLLQALREKWRNNAALQSVLCWWGTVASPAGFILINNRNSSINHWHYCFMYLWSTSAHSSFHTVMQDSNLVTKFPSISCWTETCHSPELLAKRLKLILGCKPPGACCGPPNTRTFWGWSPNPRTVLGLDFVLGLRAKFGGCLSECNERTTLY